MGIFNSGKADKESKYVDQLYDARNLGSSARILELASKVEKSEPNRKCLVLASRVLLAVNSIEEQDPKRYATLEAEFEKDLTQSLQGDVGAADALDGAVARAALFMGLGRSELALTQIPEPLNQTPISSAWTSEAIWMATCVLHGTLIRGVALERQGNFIEATDTYRSILSYVSQIVFSNVRARELQKWIEELLAHACFYFATGTPDKPAQLGEAMAAYHILAHLLDRQSRRLTTSKAKYTTLTQSTTWRVYYETLSRIASEGLVYHPSPGRRDHNTLEHRGILDEDEYTNSRNLQRRELKRVEADYERILFAGSRFPKAGESSLEIKNFLDIVMSNWQVLCGPTWTEADIGEGGKDQVSFETLATLNRAANRTFRSTQILRHIFAVNSYLGLYDQAFEAYDQYASTLSQGLARLKNAGSGKPVDVDVDDLETGFKTACAALRTVCRFGPPDLAHKNLEIASTMRSWMSLMESTQHESNGVNPKTAPEFYSLSPQARATGLRTIAISELKWAQRAYHTNMRTSLTEDAWKSIMNDANPGDQSVEDLFVKATLLAEDRTLVEATEILRSAISSAYTAKAAPAFDIVTPDNADVDRIPHFTERKLISAWHLLALLLSAKGDYSMADSACCGAFDQFDKASSKSGPTSRSGGITTDSKESSSKFFERLTVCDHLNILEKEALIEVKITQIAIQQKLIGSTQAVNATHELITLYKRLFGDYQPTGSSGTTQRAVSTPRTPPRTPPRSSGTIKSTLSAFRHSASAQRAPSILVTGDATNNSPQTLSRRKSQLLGHSRQSASLRRKNGTLEDVVKPANENVLSASPNKSHPEQQRSSPSTLKPKSLQENRVAVSLISKIWLFIARVYADASLLEDARAALAEAHRLVQGLENTLTDVDPTLKSFQKSSWGGGKSLEELWADIYNERGFLCIIQDLPHDAKWNYEQALVHDSKHLEASIGLAKICLDISAQRIPPEKVQPSLERPTLTAVEPIKAPVSRTANESTSSLPQPPALYRGAARDRAIGLLLSVTSLKQGRDSEPAWTLVVEAFEENAELGRAEAAAEWLVGLEGTSPVRPWHSVAAGSYIL